MIDKREIKEELKRFSHHFVDDESCLRFLEEQKWKDGFVCPHCGNLNYCKGKKDRSRRCTRCKKEISPTAQTLFHRCKIPLKKAFEIVYLSCKYPVISSYEMNDILNLRRMTCYHFQKKIRECAGLVREDQLVTKIKQTVTAVD